jgi:ATP-dependent RNA helicase MSS116
MFGALRRCPATLSKGLSSVAFSSRILRSSLVQSSAATRISIPQFSAVATAAFHQSAKWRQVEAAQAREDSTAHDEPVTRFEDLATRGLVHPNIINTITRQMRLETMTEVQSRTIHEALSGVDVYIVSTLLKVIC